MSTRIHAHAGRCQAPGCMKCGAGYGSEAQAVRARRHHETQAHRGLTSRVGVA